MNINEVRNLKNEFNIIDRIKSVCNLFSNKEITSIFNKRQLDAIDKALV